MMVDSTTLIRARDLTSQGFLRDLRSFLSQPAGVLQAIAEFGDRPEGFRGDRQARELNTRFNISLDRVEGILRIAEYLYVRTSSLGIGTPDAVHQIDAVASGMEDPIQIDNDRRDAIATVLSFKRAYEQSIATGKITSAGPHFTGISGYWGINTAQISNGEVIRIPVLSLSITWHDGTGNNHETFLQMSDSDLESLTDGLKDISKSRQEIEELL